MKNETCLIICLEIEEICDGGDEGYPTIYKIVFKGKLSDDLIGISKRANVYECLWNRRSLSIRYAYQILPLLANGYSNLLSNNKGCSWDEFEKLERFLKCYMKACIKHTHSTFCG